MPVEKPEIFSGFLRFSPFFYASLAKCGFSQNSILSKNKKMPNADFDLVRGIGLVERYFRAVFWEFFSPKTALFSFFTKNIVKFLCLRKEMLRIAYIYKKEDCDCHYCLYYSKGKCKLQWCCCYQDKVRTGSPFTPNMKKIIKCRKEQHDQLKNQN